MRNTSHKLNSLAMLGCLALAACGNSVYFSPSKNTQTPLSLSNAQTLDTDNYAGTPLATQPAFTLVGSQTAATLNDPVLIQAYSDSACTVPSTGSLSVAANPVNLVSGVASFSAVTYTPATAGYEANIYLKATDTVLGISTCTAKLNVLQHFSLGYGYSVWQNTADGNGGTGAYDVQSDSSGRYVVVGQSRNNGGGHELTIWRYLPNGTLDTSFNSVGYVTFGNGTGAAGGLSANEWDSGTKIRIDTNGNYVVVGLSRDNAGNTELALWRYLPSGALDTNFGSGAGFVVSGTTGAAGGLAASNKELDSANDFQIDSNGSYVIAGSSQDNAGNTELVIWRYLTSGALDTSFGSGAGFVVSGTTGAAGGLAGNHTELDSGNALQIGSGGNYVIAGSSQDNTGNTKLAIWRYLPSGVLDTSFGSGAGFITSGDGAAGNLTSDDDVVDTASTLQIDANGNYVIAGTSANNGGGTSANIELAIWRYLPSGALDTSFASGVGYLTFGIPGAAGATGSSSSFIGVHTPVLDKPYSLHIDSSGNYVISGSSADYNGGIEQAIWRYLPSGALDTSFGSGNGFAVFGPTGAAGGVSTDGEEFDEGYGMIVDQYGRYLIVGTSSNDSGDYYQAIWRYLANGSLDQ